MRRAHASQSTSAQTSEGRRHPGRAGDERLPAYVEASTRPGKLGALGSAPRALLASDAPQASVAGPAIGPAERRHPRCRAAAARGGRRRRLRAYWRRRLPIVSPPHHHLSTVEFDQWRVLYRRALAAGCARVIDIDDERVAAPDELVALAVPGLVRLGGFALLADAIQDAAPDCAHALGCEAAGALRLFDRALAAHGRAHGYPVAAWLEHAIGAAHATAGAVSRLNADAAPLTTVVRDAADAVAAAVIALHRDRLAVPGALADALGAILVLHVAAAGEAG
jgi:hypothetical protein